MQKFQSGILRTYLMITSFLVGAGILFPENENLWLIRYVTILSLFLISILHQIKEKTQTRLSYALLFAVIGDAFLYLALPLKFIKLNIPLGLISFTMAYGIIASAYLKVLFSIKKTIDKFFYLKLLSLLLLIGSFIIYFLRKTTSADLFFGSIFISSLIFVFLMAINIFFSTLISKRLRVLILLSSTLMVVCDIGVILGFSLPSLDPMIFNIGSSIVWSAYIPAWTIICILSMDTEFSKISSLQSS